MKRARFTTSSGTPGDDRTATADLASGRFTATARFTAGGTDAGAETRRSIIPGRAGRELAAELEREGWDRQ